MKYYIYHGTLYRCDGKTLEYRAKGGTWHPSAEFLVSDTKNIRIFKPISSLIEYFKSVLNYVYKVDHIKATVEFYGNKQWVESYYKYRYFPRGNLTKISRAEAQRIIKHG